MLRWTEPSAKVVVEGRGAYFCRVGGPPPPLPIKVRQWRLTAWSTGVFWEMPKKRDPTFSHFSLLRKISFISSPKNCEKRNWQEGGNCYFHRCRFLLLLSKVGYVKIGEPESDHPSPSLSRIYHGKQTAQKKLCVNKPRFPIFFVRVRNIGCHVGTESKW